MTEQVVEKAVSTTPVEPTGYRTNAAGHLVPESKIEAIDLLRDELVKELTSEAEDISKQLQQFKVKALMRVQDFIDLSAQTYGQQIGGKKGNASLVSFDGNLMVKRNINENITFDERLIVAKSLIDSCIHEWTQGGNDNIKALVEHAFQTDKEGNISVTRILGLRRLDIEDEQWLKAMEAIADSISITGSKTYLRLYQRNAKDAMAQISLDIASA
ncbi:DUF3164 family protein [Colwellia psychrerythraea]|uniref:Sulfate transporter n=1 Tax=Colwellia psychrerythraea TaxID=28229 RepID=A0A099K8J6_COLPS|nr:DUF3164 family protein [Colwellia psychrerythraea]KGJ86417.1 Protein of unknown function DUF3164 [Colwellia psychrerythraea]